MNPYIGKGFFGFLKTLGVRLFSLQGPLASDEVQLLTFLAVGVSCALCGTFLVLRRSSMLANALSHTVLLGLVIAFWIFGFSVVWDMKVLGLSALITGWLTTWLAGWLTHTLRMQSESAIALVFTALFSLAVTMTCLLTKNLHLGVESVSGSGDLLSIEDLRLALALGASTLLGLVLFYKPLTFSTFDSALAASTGVRIRLVHVGLMCQSAACIVGGFRCVGVVMVLTFFVAPALFARLFARHLSTALLFASALVASCTLVGCASARALLSSYYIPVSTGALVATLLVFATTLALICKRKKPLRFSQRSDTM